MTIDRDKIELLAAANGMNSTQVAEAARMSRQNLSTIKTRGTCTALSAVKIADALHVDVVEILKKDG